MVLAAVVVVAAAAGFLVWSNRDVIGEPISTSEWATRYCAAVEPYKTGATQLVSEIETGVATGGAGTTLKPAMLSFGTLADDFLAKVLRLAEDHPIADEGGARLATDLQASVTTARDHLRRAVEQVRLLDAAEPGFVTQAIGVLASNGISLDTRMTIKASPAFNRLNVAIGTTTGCSSLFTVE